MTDLVSSWASITTLDDNGSTIPRFTNFRAVIPLDENRRYPANCGEVTLRIEARDADKATAGNPGDGNLYLYETSLQGAHVDDSPATYLPIAVQILAEQGFKLTGEYGADNGRLTAGIEVAA